MSEACWYSVDTMSWLLEGKGRQSNRTKETLGIVDLCQPHQHDKKFAMLKRKKW
jgi:hypothetical protein